MPSLRPLTNDAEKLLQMLGLPYRVVCLSAGDLGFSSAMTYDIEVWLPSYNRYCEISAAPTSRIIRPAAPPSVIRTGRGTRPNSSTPSTARVLPWAEPSPPFLKNYQNADGTVTVPEVLRKYMNTDIIG